MNNSWKDSENHFIRAMSDPWYQLITKLMSDIVYKTGEFYKNKGFAAALMPITCNSISSPMGLGSDSVPVKIDLFGYPTYLADSMQFQLEYMLRNTDANGVWYIMPTFRGEDPDEMHLNQFFHSEAEILGDLKQVQKLIVEYLNALTEQMILNNNIKDKSHLEKFLELNGNIPEISLDEAVKLLPKDCFKEPVPGHKHIDRKGERELIKMFGGAVWLSYMDSKCVPFYQALSDDKKHAKCADLLLGPGEVLGCGERHYYWQELENTIINHKVNPKEYDWYIKMKKEKPLLTSGFGLGLERFLLWVLKYDDIRDIHIMPRLKNIKAAV